MLHKSQDIDVVPEKARNCGNFDSLRAAEVHSCAVDVAELR